VGQKVIEEAVEPARMPPLPGGRQPEASQDAQAKLGRKGGAPKQSLGTRIENPPLPPFSKGGMKSGGGDPCLRFTGWEAGAGKGRRAAGGG